jgi:leucyl aminopeptidase
MAFEFVRYDGAIASLEVDLLVIGVAQGEGFASGAAADVDAAFGGGLKALAAEESFEGKEGQSLLVHTFSRISAKRVLFVGLGKTDAHSARLLGALAGRRARDLDVRTLAVAASTISGSAGLGVSLGFYRYDQWKTEGVKAKKLERVYVVGLDAPSVEQVAVAEGVALARDLVNGPPVSITPEKLASTAVELASAHGLECTIFNKAALEAKGMALLLAVSAGSDREPRLIHLTWRPAGATDATPAIALVGKGLTFDAGGLNLKPAGSIEDMKMDMAGGAAVLGAMRAIAAVKPNIVVHGIIPSSENLLGGSAYKLGDVFKSYLGKTVEIMNTDAEGRLILADALAYANEQKPREIVDLATLTGAICVALGNDRAGIFGNDDGTIAAVEAAGAAAGELYWKMPLDHSLWKQMKSDVADMKNVGKRWGGAITGALFLNQFIGKTPWVHLDIAGPAWAEANDGHVSKGGTGFGVMTLVEYVKRASDRLTAS